MKIHKTIMKKIIASILVAVMFITQLAVIDIKAADITKVTSITTLERNEFEEWIMATAYDHFSWNAFHNAVERDIRAKYENKIDDKEKFLKGFGKADLSWEEGNEILLWEVKPADYGINPIKEAKALTQLNRYINADISKHRVGDSRIADGHTSVSKSIYRGTYIEHVTYEIDYQNAQNGLILYHFERSSTIEELEEETEVETEIVWVTGTATDIIDDIVVYVPVFTQEEIVVDFATLVATCAFAKVLLAYNQRLMENPYSQNSASAEIVAACIAFISLVNPAIMDGMLNGGELSEEYITTVNTAMLNFATAMQVFDMDELMTAMYSADVDKIEELTKGIQDLSEMFDAAGEEQPPRDPLIIDLGSEGIELCSLENGVNFDLDNNGFAEKTAWIGKEDGFLAYDRNGNGIIDNGGELFGDQVFLKDGSKSVSGFEALKEFDSNGDGVVNKADEEFSKLVLWIDENHNGSSENGEIKSLDVIGVQSISLGHSEISFVDEATGTRIAETSSVELNMNEEISYVDISEFWFPVNSSDTTQGDVVTVGNIPEIYQAMVEDETGKLCELFCSFDEAYDISEKRYYLKQILYYLADAEDIEINSRGGNIDARDLKVIEAFMGREFVGVDGTNPNVNAAKILKELYVDIENQYYNILNMYSRLGGCLKSVYEYEDENGNKQLEMVVLNEYLTMRIDAGENVDTLVYDLGVYLTTFDEMNGTDYFNEYSQLYGTISTHYYEIVEQAKACNTYIGTDNIDTYFGGNFTDFIFGEAGDDSLYGENGIDIIHGNSGNDRLYGGLGDDKLYGTEGDDVYDGGHGEDVFIDTEGNDTYIIASDSGNDIIIDNGGSNIIKFSNLYSEDIMVNGTGENDATILVKNSSSSITISDFCENIESQDYMLEFTDKTVHCLDEDSPFKHIYGTDSDDNLKAVVDDTIINAFCGNDTVTGSRGNDVIYGNVGNDIIYAKDGNDNIYGGIEDDIINGEDGDDIIFGHEGSDVLDGGAGNDYIFDDSGDDTCVFGKGYGTDIVEDSDGKMTIRLDDVCESDLEIFSTGNEAIIIIKDTNDKLIISGYGEAVDNYVICFNDTSKYLKDIISETVPEYLSNVDITVATEKYISGTDSSDAIFAENISNIIATGYAYDYIVGCEQKDIVLGGADTDRVLAGYGADIVYGGSGNDQLLGEDENDLIVAGTGNDYINGASGDDIFIMGYGDDFIEDSAGNDIYYFNLGDGNDSIMDNEGLNCIILGDGLYSDDIKAYRDEWNDLLITFENTSDTIKIKNYCIDETSRNFKFVFSDGSVYLATDDDSELKNIYDVTGTEYMPSIYTDGITIISSDGDDQLVGSDYTDTLIGGAGNNRITGYAGDDCIDGGLGNDYLSGGTGSDTYVYTSGYGTDTISDSEGINTIEINEYSLSDIKAYRTNWNNLTLVFDGTGETALNNDYADKIIIEGFFVSENNRQFYLSFNGSFVYATDSLSPLRTLYGTAAVDYMQGFDNDVIILYGNEGADTLNGGEAGDYLYGGSGDDRILGMSGNDTLSGDSGNDYLEGGAGDDTYVFESGSGTDTINDNQGVNSICLADGFTKELFKTCRTNWNDLTISFEGLTETIVIQGYFVSEENREFNIIFSDGTCGKLYVDENSEVTLIFEEDM